MPNETNQKPEPSAKKLEAGRQTWNVFCRAGTIVHNAQESAAPGPILLSWVYGVVAFLTAPVTGPGIAAIDYFTRSNITKSEIEALQKKVCGASAQKLNLLCSQIAEQSPKSKSSRELREKLRTAQDPEEKRTLLHAYLTAEHNAGKATMQTMQNFFSPSAENSANARNADSQSVAAVLQ